MSDYAAFLAGKQHYSDSAGFAPSDLPSELFDFQSALVEWACWKGRAAIFADCGLGKTPIQLAWADQVVRRSNRPVLVLAPLAASAQTVREAAKFHIEAERSRDGRRSSGARIVITNYEQLHHFDPADYIGVVCDESSILKNFDGKTKAAITEFMRRLPYRLLCTATAAPNDYIELGTSSEALGEMGYTDMLTRFFANDDNTIEPMSYSAAWRFKPHAEPHFWRWLCSWARALRRPSDIGYSDGRFVLPPLTVDVQTVAASRPLDGQLFARPAATLQEQRAERRATLTQRCEAVAAHAQGRDSFIAWAHLNDEGDLIARLIPDSVQVSGKDSDERKEEVFEAFSAGQIRALVTKPRIAAFGMNWQHCARMSFFPSHSYEQYYQSVRRCWRFGQSSPVTVHVITTEGEADVLGNLQRKADAANRMFASMVAEMQYAMGAPRPTYTHRPTIAPAWLQEATIA